LKWGESFSVLLDIIQSLWDSSLYTYLCSQSSTLKVFLKTFETPVESADSTDTPISGPKNDIQPCFMHTEQRDATVLSDPQCGCRAYPPPPTILPEIDQ
jgi:hypothetical protein